MRNALNKTRIILILCLWMIASMQAIAQSVQVKGKVSDASTNEALPGVNILLKGTTVGAISMGDGTYSINIPKGGTLVFSFIGYLTTEVIINEQTSVNVSLTPEISKLDEVLVIGYGVQKKSDKTGAVANVTSKEIAGGVLTDPLQGIQGKLAGVSISKQGGDPNAGFAVTIRGAISMSASTDPLYIIDGVPGADPTTIASEDIESYNVLKDASSTAIYGARGSNGVIIITTKSGQQKKGSSVEINSYVSTDIVAKKLDLMTAADWRTYATSKGLTLNDGGANTDWQNEIFRKGISTSTNVAVSGGNDNSSYRISATTSDFSGVLIGTEKKRNIGRIDLTQKALENKLTVTAALSGTIEGNDYVNYGGNGQNDVLFQAYQRNPTDPVYKDGNYYEISRDFNYWNPVAIIHQIQNHRDAKRMLGNLKAVLDITRGLSASVSLGYIRNDDESFYFEPTTLASNALGDGSRSYNNYYSKVLESTLVYNTKIADHHNLDIIGGYSFQQEGVDGFNAGGQGPTSNYLTSNNLGSLTNVIAGTNIGSYNKEGRLISFFGRATYNYDSKYYLSASLRNDGSSKFGENKKWGLFPAVSAGWTLSEEGFLKGLDFLNFLKLRAGYGTSGNQGIDYNLSVRNAHTTGPAINPETGLPSIGYDFGYNNNPDLQWEVTSEINLGLDFSLFKGRISGSLEVYDKTTDKLLYPYSVPVPPFSERTQWANFGKIGNKGIELSLQGFIIDNANLNWKATATFTLNRQSVISLGGGIYQWTPQHVGWLSGRGLVGSENWTQIVQPGLEIGTFYMPQFVTINSAGKFEFATAAGGITSDPANAERRAVGHAMPRWIGGLSNYFTIYKFIDVSFAIRVVEGNDVLNVTRLVLGNPTLLNNLSDNLLRSALTDQQKGFTSPPEVNSYYLEDGSFIRLDNVSIGYTFGAARSKWLKGLRVYFAGNNLLTITKYTGVDPESSYKGLSFGLDQYNTYPKTISYSIGVNYKF